MIDTHLHLIEPQLFAYPWLAGAPQLQSGHGFTDWQPLAARAGIRGSLFTEVDVAEDDIAREAKHFCQLADETAEGDRSGILGVIAACRPERDDFVRQLDRMAHPRLRGLRRVLHVVDDAVSESEPFRRHIALLADYGLTFDLCLRADQLALGLELARSAPATQLILDHCGNPPLADEVAVRQWREDIARLAEEPNVACKVSGLVNHVPASADALLALQPVVDHVADCFGWQRLIFGGDWPVSRLAGRDLPHWAELAHRLLARQPQDTVAAFFTDNAQRIYALPQDHD
jgi:predicted TIM-barrel fold metal-dependent hydrolase